jgi:hypothetical protein
MLKPNIKKMLLLEEQPENIRKLTDYLRGCHKRSRGVMSKHYKKWDRNLAVYRGEHIMSESDYDAAAAGEPQRSVIPLSYAQVQSFTAFGFMLYTQNPEFYEFTPSGAEDFRLKEVVEAVLARDLRANQHQTRLYQFFLDMARMGVAPLKHWWTVDTQHVDMVTPEASTLSDLGVLEGAKLTSEQLTKFEGNRLINVSPYKFLPDARLPLTRWNEGQFVADEDEWHITNIKELEKAGRAAGTQFVRKMSKGDFEARGESRLPQIVAGFDESGSDSTDFMVSRIEGNAWLIPAKYGLGPEEHKVLFSYLFANDRLIYIGHSGYLHDSFNYELAQWSPDQESTVSSALSDTVHALQDMITFLYNSRTESVRRSLEEHLIVHPMYVDMSALESRSRIVQLTKNAPLTDIRQLVQQLDIKDSTTTHFADADLLRSTMQFVTGVNDNAMGQYSGGRRSATEARSANAGSASRIRIPCQLAFQSAWAPAGIKMLSNHRQGISFETFVKIVGQKNADLFEQFAPASPSELVGNEDFFTFDATMQSEKGFLAQSLQELVVTMMNNSEVAAAQGFNFEKAISEIQYLRGVKNAARLFTKPASGTFGAGSQGPPDVPGLSGLPAGEGSV